MPPAKKAAAKKTAEAQAVEPTAPTTTENPPAGDDSTVTPTKAKATVKKAAKAAENWVSTNNGVRFGRL